MDKYHINEEIGKGEFSQVFKGREKKKIEYVAIKRLDKSVMSKVVAEVQVMHKLSHPHMLKFHDWYETRNNLWLILEYCTGGDLESILKQDGHIPETSVRIFGIDIVAGLKYLHSNGYIHGDLRPRNFLVDEYGILKLADFKFAQKIPRDVLGTTPLASRGCPPYMAPELFTPEGVHSFQSDFWALGCVLYELRRGFLPFGDPSVCSMETLVDRIRTLDPVENPLTQAIKGVPIPSLSPELADCLLWLLEKAPMNRSSWPALCAHPFWAPSNITAPTDLPSQTAFEALVRDLERARSEQLEQSANSEFSIDHGPKQRIEASQPPQAPPVTQGTPLRMPVYGSTPLRDEVARTGRGATPATAALATMETPGRVGGLSTVDEQSTPVVNRHNPSAKQGFQASEILREEENSPRSRVPTPMENVDRFSSHSAASQAKDTVQAYSQPGASSRLPADRSAGSKGADPSPSSGPTPASLYGAGVSAASLLLHPSELQVKPIVGNKLIESIDGFDYSASALPFRTLEVDSLTSVSPADIEAHLTAVYKALHKTAVAAQATTPTPAVVQALNERVNILKYLCNIAASAEVSNIILNTHFLTLVLKLLRHTVTYSDRSTSVRSTATQQSIVQNAQSLFHLSRFWCATLLALLLRYATFIQPPPAKAREDHILATLVNLLKDVKGGAGLDGKLKKRVVAALGEMIFYITAQEGEEGAAADVDQWFLPSIAIEVLGKCLREDNDDVVKHYAAKTIENCLAQGGIQYRYRFISLDIASKLLEIAQSSVHEALQATCATALSHTICLVLSTHLMGPQVASMLKEMSHATTMLNKTTNAVASLSSTRRANPPQLDPFQSPLVTSSAKFVAKIFEKANFPAILDQLRDGQPKVQQSFINIINAFFSAPLFSVDALRPEAQNTDAEAKNVVIDSNLEAAVKTALTPLKSYFVRAHAALLPIMFRMMEQGSLTIIRSKAFLLCCHLCQNLPALLVSLGERRLPLLLIRLLEPALSVTEPAKAAQPTYLIKCALVLVSQWKSVAQLYMRELASHLEEISLLSPELLAAESAGSGTPQGKKTTGLSPGFSSPSHQQRSPSGKDGLGGYSKPIEKLSFTATQLKQVSELLRSVISLVAAQPMLARLVFGGNEAFIRELAKALRELPVARSTVLSVASKLLPNDMKESILIAEQACLASVEAIAQIDIPEYSSAMAAPSPDTDRAQQGWPWQLDWPTFVVNGLHDFLPALAQLLAHPDGDIRAVVASCLRRLMPAFLRSHVTSGPQEEKRLALATACYQTVLPYVSPLLVDQAPIPQYITRLLVETMGVHKQFAVQFIPALQQYGILSVLVGLLRNSGNAAGGAGTGMNDNHSSSEDGESFVLDPQLVVLIHSIFDHNEGANLLLQADLGGALSVAIIGAVYMNISYPFRGVGSLNQDLLVTLIELLYHVLHFVLREVSSDTVPSSAGKGGMRSPQRHIQAEQHRRFIMPLRAVSPALLLMVAFIEHCGNLFPAMEGDAAAGDQHLHSILVHLLDLCCRSMGVLFDLFPDALTSQLLSKQSVALDPSSGERSATETVLSPRLILAHVLKNKHTEGKVKVKFLKIIYGLLKVSVNVGMAAKAKEFALSEPLYSAIVVCSKPTGPSSASKGRSQQGDSAVGEVAASMMKMAVQVLDAANSL